jgi:prephenate dehydrogenase
LAAKKHKLAARIIGVTAHKDSLRKALRRKAIDSGTLDLKKSVINSDMVVLATPVDKVISTLKELSHSLKKGCIVIDVASVKQGIVDKAERIIGRRGVFVGTHPMAGSEQRGVEKADVNLFKGAVCILTKTGKTDKKALAAVSDFWKKLGAKIYILSPAEHDKEISNVSHLPHAVAYALSAAVRPLSVRFAATGLKDTTRIASSDPDLWASILVENRRNVGNDIKIYLKELKRIGNEIACGRKDHLRKLLRGAKEKRDKLISNER